MSSRGRLFPRGPFISQVHKCQVGAVYFPGARLFPKFKNEKWGPFISQVPVYFPSSKMTSGGRLFPKFKNDKCRGAVYFPTPQMTSRGRLFPSWPFISQCAIYFIQVFATKAKIRMSIHFLILLLPNQTKPNLHSRAPNPVCSCWLEFYVFQRLVRWLS